MTKAALRGLLISTGTDCPEKEGSIIHVHRLS